MRRPRGCVSCIAIAAIGGVLPSGETASDRAGHCIHGKVVMKPLRIIPGLLLAISALIVFPACAELEGDAAALDPDEEIGVAVSELAYNVARIQQENPQPIQLAGSLFSGYTDNRTTGGLCRTGQNRD